MCNLKKGDQVIAISGNDKGKSGKILKVYPSKNRACVEGINLIKKHVKRDPNNSQPGSIITKEAAIDISNLAIYNPITKKPDRIKIKYIVDSDNKMRKIRCFLSTNEVIDV